MANDSEAALRGAMPPIFSDRDQESVMSERTISRRLLALALLGFAFLTAASGQATEGKLSIKKIDPPNWWVQMPAPMLLVRGEGLRGARFSLSDPALGIAKTAVSGNGHWAQLWLTTPAVG